MQTALQDPQTLRTYSPEEQEAVRLQMKRLLESSHFRNSRRYPTLLRHIIEETLSGRGSLLKERTLGAEVFGRAPDYDTSSDPIVRVTVAEIRKRIAQYYHEDAHGSELRIELTPGSYLPEFVPGRSAEEPERLEPPPTVVQPATIPPAPVEAVETAGRGLSRQSILLILFALVVVAGAAGVAAWHWLRPTPVDALWAPVFAADGPITYCLPMSARKRNPGSAESTAKAIAHAMDLADNTVPASGTFLDHQVLGENVVYSDVLAMMRLERVVEQQRRPVRFRLNFSANLNDLREGPAIFIGGLSNQWTLKMLAPLRYRFGGSDADVYYILDEKDPGNKQWDVRLHDRYAAVKTDYAIIARVHNEELGHTVLVAAGIGMSGTAAAGEFLADPAQVAELQRRIGATALKDRDFEVILRTDVDNGIAGAAQIVAVDVR